MAYFVLLISINILCLILLFVNYKVSINAKYMLFAYLMLLCLGGIIYTYLSNRIELVVACITLISVLPYTFWFILYVYKQYKICKFLVFGIIFCAIASHFMTKFFYYLVKTSGGAGSMFLNNDLQFIYINNYVFALCLLSPILWCVVLVGIINIVNSTNMEK